MDVPTDHDDGDGDDDDDGKLMSLQLSFGEQKRHTERGEPIKILLLPT